MLDVRLYLAQRVSAMVLAPLVLGHLALILLAVHDGLSAAEILGRTRGSVWWTLYYGLFVLAASVHGAIGLRTLAHEYLRLAGTALTVLTWLTGLTLLALGGRAVIAVTL